MKRIEFLDMVIQDTGNSDGVTLVINNASYGNFGTNWDMAKLWALRWFMIRRPETFGHTIAQKLHRQGGGTWGEFDKFAEACNKEGLTIPLGVTCEGHSRLLQFNGQTV